MRFSDSIEMLMRRYDAVVLSLFLQTLYEIIFQVAWISEKDVVLSSDDYGRDLASVQALQRKHEGVERDLAALEDKVLTLGKEAER